MKKINAVSLFAIISSTLVFNYSCNVDLPQYKVFDSYVYASVDEDGGDWELLYLTGTDLVPIPAPAETTSP